MVLEKKFANTGFSIKPELTDPLTLGTGERSGGGGTQSAKGENQAS